MRLFAVLFISPTKTGIIAFVCSDSTAATRGKVEHRLFERALRALRKEKIIS
jgi:hypothetical protein